MSGKKYPFRQWSNVHEDMKRLFQNPQINLVEKFSNTTGVMQSKETLFLVAETYVKIRARQGFRYCEATIAPQYHVFGGLSEKEVIDVLINGIKEGEKVYSDIEVNLLFSIGREVSSDEAVRLVNVAGECDKNYVVGIGLVCDEAAHPPEKHKSMFKIAKKLGFKTTCHAGEWCHMLSQKPNWERDKDMLLRNIRIAIHDLEVDRLDHAIPLAYDHYLIEEVIKRRIGVTSCPGNYLSSGLISGVEYLKIRELLAAGVLFSLHPDDDLFMPSLNEVFQICDDAYKFTNEEKQLLIKNACLTRFGNRKVHKF